MRRTGRTEPGRRVPFSVRTRITVALALLTASALTAAGFLVWALESSRIDSAAAEDIDHEFAELTQLAAGNDPDTARPFANVTRLLEVYLARNVPDEGELLLGYDGRPAPLHTDVDEYDDLVDDPAFDRAREPLMAAGGTASFDSAELGEVLVAALPVSSGDTHGALVVARLLDVEHAELSRTMRTFAVVAALSLGVITLAAAWQSGRLLAPLRVLRETAEDITATDLSRRIPETGHDDITALTRTLNDMLERLEAGFAAQRDFLDDAGHELRTPLTILRGNLELLDDGDPVDLAATRALLLDETDRMSRLVNDLIVLAKSRRPDFVRTAPVDVDRLTRDVLAKAQVLGDRDWRLDGSAAVIAPLDEQRVTQALLQLADNAVKHTTAGDTIGLGSSDDGHAVRLWVRDTGTGVPAEDRDRIFERFARGTVTSGDDGFGLGLSIVAAIVAAHHGRVEVLDASPGSRFVIALPTDGGPWHAS